MDLVGLKGRSIVFEPVASLEVEGVGGRVFGFWLDAGTVGQFLNQAAHPII